MINSVVLMTLLNYTAGKYVSGDQISARQNYRLIN